MVSIMGLPQHSGAFSMLRLALPVQLISYSPRSVLPQRVHRKMGIAADVNGIRVGFRGLLALVWLAWLFASFLTQPRLL